MFFTSSAVYLNSWCTLCSRQILARRWISRHIVLQKQHCQWGLQYFTVRVPPWDVITLNPPAIHQFLINICILDRRGGGDAREEGRGRLLRTHTHTFMLINWNKMSLGLKMGRSNGMLQHPVGGAGVMLERCQQRPVHPKKHTITLEAWTSRRMECVGNVSVLEDVCLFVCVSLYCIFLSCPM